MRWILHVDMDEFFVAVERLYDESLAGKCVLIGSKSPRGVVATASYEARAFGCHSAMPMTRALRLCPHAVVVRPTMERYGEWSGKVFDIFTRFTPLVEPLSIDEAFLDVTGSRRLLGEPIEIAREIKRAIRSELGLVASVGIAPNKFLAKIASDLEKPDGLTVIAPDATRQTLDPLAIRKLWGVGPKTAELFERRGIRTVGQLRTMDLDILESFLSPRAAAHFLSLSRGEDDRPLVTDSRAKSIGQEQTFTVDNDDDETLHAVLLDQTLQVARRLRRAGLYAGSVSIKIRSGDFRTFTRSRKLPESTQTTEVLLQKGRELFDAFRREKPFPVRLLGITAESLSDSGGGQMSLFSQTTRGDEKHKRIDSAVDSITERYGDSAIRRARQIDPDEPS
ncbi:MAG: DNA polymerase IV [Phycisphaerales bacterium]|nr:DNA polymerase IV [Phycisphaerales bacterium]MBT7170580.1 DNA polymerase IV [Phycisphaerales bacterium]